MEHQNCGSPLFEKLEICVIEQHAKSWDVKKNGPIYLTIYVVGIILFVSHILYMGKIGT